MTNTIIEHAEKTAKSVLHLPAEHITAQLLDKDSRMKLIKGNPECPMDSLQFEMLWISTFIDYINKYNPKAAKEVMLETTEVVSETTQHINKFSIDTAYLIGFGMGKLNNSVIMEFAQHAIQAQAGYEWVRKFFNGVLHDATPEREKEIESLLKAATLEMDRKNNEIIKDISTVEICGNGSNEEVPARVRAFMVEVAALDAPIVSMSPEVQAIAQQGRKDGVANAEVTLRRLIKMFNKYNGKYPHIYLLNFVTSILIYSKDVMKGNQLKECFLNWLRVNPTA